ncbi:MAG: SDR family oxidoreductase [Candidatus Krumholzibacteriota bacterium]|nr:SDR family oxidoreductase [Candidatus Krumholzibacteriota bacterium]
MSKSVLITGTSSGFGLLTAKTLAEAGYEVYATMRGTDGKNKDAATALRTWAGEGDRSLEVVELDVTDDASVAAAAKIVQEKSGGIDVLVNNAGIVSMGINEAFNVEDYKRIFDVNVYGPLRVTNAFLPKMREKGHGLIITISSIMGRIIIPFAGPYTASKWALEGLFETWRYELAPLGIDNVIIEPGAFPTEIGAKMNPPSNASVTGQYGPTQDAFNEWMSGFEQLFAGDTVPNPQDVADAVRKSIETPRGEREFRVIVDSLMADAPTAINTQYVGAQRQLLNALGMGGLEKIQK